MISWTLPSDDDFGTPHLPRPDDTIAGVFLVRTRGAVAQSRADPRGGAHLVAFGTACTHMGCLLVRGEGEGEHNIVYRPPSGDGPETLVCGPCPCHGTSFDLTLGGLVILGPATQNLPQMALEVDGDQVKGTGWLDEIVDPREEAWPLAAGGGASP